MWLLFAVGSALFAGLTTILAKIGLDNINSTIATAIRTLFVLLFSWMMVFVVGSQRELQTIDPKSLIFLILSGLSTGASWLCYFRALQIGSVNRVAPIDQSSTVLTVLLAFLFLGEPLSLSRGIGTAGLAVGIFLMATRKSETISSAKGKGSAWFLFAAGSALFASLTAIFGKIGVTGIEPNLSTAIRTIIVLLMAWIMVFVTKSKMELKTLQAKSWLFLFLSGLATGLSWLCYYHALRHGPASLVVPIDKSSILLTVFFSTLIFKEKFPINARFGLLLFSISTLLMIWNPF